MIGGAGDTWRSLRSVFVNPALARMQLALAVSMVGDWAFSTAVTVYAYQAGGAKLVGGWFAARLVLMALLAPLAASFADRLPRKKVLVVSDLVRALLTAVAGVLVLRDAPALAIIVLSTVTGLIGCVSRPTQLAWMPSLTNEPGELTAANGAYSTTKGLAFLVGPTIGAVLVATTSIEAVFALNVVSFGVSGIVLYGIRPVSADVPRAPGHHGALREMAGGFREIAGNRDLVLIAGMLCAQNLVHGTTIVLGVTWAVEILMRGPEAVGIIDTVFGVGAISGGLLAIARANRNRLATDIAAGALLWSLPLLFIVVWPSAITVFAATLLMGVGKPLVDVNFTTLVQRIVVGTSLARVFGVFQGAWYFTMAVGALVAPLLIDGLGTGLTLSVLAVVVGLPTLLVLPRCLRLDATLREPEGTHLLRGIPMFAPLPQSAIETLARSLVHERVPAGTRILREGQSADRFFIIERGLVTVTQDGRHLRDEAPGEFFGEIGLLRDVPRTATVTAVEDTELWTLAREPFLDAVLGTDAALQAADEIVTRRLG
jgi:MFS family permease